MASIREHVLRCIPLERNPSEADDSLADSLYFLMRNVPIADACSDGWSYFYVIHESDELLEIAGLMTLLPEGAIPVTIRLLVDGHSVTWSARFGQLEPAWIALSTSKQWSRVYLFANGDRTMPDWKWGSEYTGTMQCDSTDRV